MELLLLAAILVAAWGVLVRAVRGCGCALALAFLLLSAPVVANASVSAFSVLVFDASTGAGIPGVVVTGTPADGSLALAALQTDDAGIANFGQLAPGDWRFEACGQSLVYGSADSNTAGLWMVPCSRLWLPVVQGGHHD